MSSSSLWLRSRLKTKRGSLCRAMRTIFSACFMMMSSTLRPMSIIHRPEKPLATSVTGTLTAPPEEDQEDDLPF